MVSNILVDTREINGVTCNLVAALGVNNNGVITYISPALLFTQEHQLLNNLLGSGLRCSIAYPKDCWPCLIAESSTVPTTQVSNVIDIMTANIPDLENIPDQLRDAINDVFTSQGLTGSNFASLLAVELMWRENPSLHVGLPQLPQYYSTVFPETFQTMQQSAGSAAGFIVNNQNHFQSNPTDELFFAIPTHSQLDGCGDDYSYVLPSLESLGSEYTNSMMESTNYTYVCNGNQAALNLVLGSQDNYVPEILPNETRYYSELLKWAATNAAQYGGMIDPETNKVYYDEVTQDYLLELAGLLYMRGHRHIPNMPIAINYNADEDMSDAGDSKYIWIAGTDKDAVAHNAILSLQSYLKKISMETDSSIIVKAIIYIARWGERKIEYLEFEELPDYPAFNLNTGTVVFDTVTATERNLDAGTQNLELTPAQEKCVEVFGISREEASLLSLETALSSDFVISLTQQGTDISAILSPNVQELKSKAALGYGTTLQLLLLEIYAENQTTPNAPLLSKFIGNVESSVVAQPTQQSEPTAVESSNVFNTAPTTPVQPQQVQQPMQPQPVQQQTPAQSQQVQQQAVPTTSYVAVPTLEKVANVVYNGQVVAQVDISNMELNGKMFNKYIVLEESRNVTVEPVNLGLLMAFTVSGYKQALCGKTNAVQLFFESDKAFISFRDKLVSC